ncbi:uncharacterized protein VTP21DRAFT_8598 [Calcarisporiella thermophila]|uniref:uncharacterized protein n=1 Tax=Calcarisporiella thermophila TaxID=911321 RepID=UPI0037432F37
MDDAPEREEVTATVGQRGGQTHKNHDTLTEPNLPQLVFSSVDLPDSTINDKENRWMLGRRFCTSPGVHYILPNDEEEVDRLISQHYFIRSLFGNRDFLSPVHIILQSGAKVLDAGCGPGTWAMEMASEYPNSQFYGIDISNMFPLHSKPSNCTFQIANILKKLSFEDNKFDFPGGYVEIVDADYSIQCDERATMKLIDGIYNTLRARDIHPSWGRRVGDILQTMGVEDVQSLTQRFPVGKHSDRDGRSGLEQWMRFLIAMRPHLAQVMYISGDEYDELLQRASQELSMNEISIEVMCTYGKKPLKLVKDDERIEMQPEDQHKPEDK